MILVWLGLLSVFDLNSRFALFFDVGLVCWFTWRFVVFKVTFWFFVLLLWCLVLVWNYYCGSLICWLIIALLGLDILVGGLHCLVSLCCLLWLLWFEFLWVFTLSWLRLDLMCLLWYLRWLVMEAFGFGVFSVFI